MTGSATTTQQQQPHDNTITHNYHYNDTNRNATQNQMKTSKQKYTSKRIKKRPNTFKNEERQDIADVIADFYEELYTSTTKTHEHKHEHENKYEQHQDTMTPFTMQDLNDAINQLKGGKAADTRGVNAKISNKFYDCTKKAIHPNEQPPSNWRETTIKMIFKSGGQASPSNYRPIRSISILYNLFGRLVFKRRQPSLDANQSADQAGFRPSFSTTDYLTTFQQL